MLTSQIGRFLVRVLLSRSVRTLEVCLSSRVPANVVVCQLIMYSNVIVGITISHGSFVFSQSRVKVSASLTNVGSLAVGAFDLVNCSLPEVLVFHFGQ